MNEATQSNNNQRGGVRPGAGRPKGSYQKPRVSDFVTFDDAREFIAIAKKRALEDGKDDLLKFLINHAFGQPRQNVGIDGGDEDKPIEFKNVSAMSPEEIDEFIKSKLTGSKGN